MEIKNFTITKRDGSKDQFSLDKIMNAILKAFDSVEQPTDLGAISKILSRLDIHNDITVEDIQNQVEEALMREGYYKVAKSFMLYRQYFIPRTVRHLPSYSSCQNIAIQ